MVIRVLGCAGAEFPGFNPPAFLVDGSLLFDAGTLGAVLDEEEQWGITHIFVTHSHLDHVRGIPVLADNIIIKKLSHTVKVVGTREVIGAIRTHLMNDILWPDFSKIPSTTAPVISYCELDPGVEYTVGDYTVTAFPVSHSVPAVGYFLRKSDKSFLYTGDTGPTEVIWQHASHLSALIIEVSFPNAMEEMALLTGHMTPNLLGRELAKLSQLPPLIMITHPKPQYYEVIKAELNAMGLDQVELLQDGKSYAV